MSGKVKCTCGWSWNKSDSSKKDMYICHECGRDNSNNMKNGGWLDNYGEEDNYNDYNVSAPEGFEGDGYSNVGRNSSPAWGGQFQLGGSVYPVNYVPEAQTGGSFPGATGFSYARTGSIPSKGPHRNQTDKTDASAQNGKEMQYYQQGLDWQPKTISKNGGWLDKHDVAQEGTKVKFDPKKFAADKKRNTPLQRSIDKEAQSEDYRRWVDTQDYRDQVKANKIAEAKAKVINDKAIVQDRKDRINKSVAAQKKSFTKDNWRQQLADETQAAGDKFRMFPEDPDSFIDEWINPGVMIGNMASDLGSAPLRAQQEDSYMPYVTSIGVPLLTGGLEGLGAKTNKQFVSNLVNPLNIVPGYKSAERAIGKKLGTEEGLMGKVSQEVSINRNLSKIKKEGQLQGLSEHEIAKKQMEQVGITSNQRKGYTPVVSELAEKYVTPQGYIGYDGNSKLSQIIENIKQGGVDYTKIRPERIDAWKLYLGRPQVSKTFSLADTAPAIHPSYKPGSLKGMDIYNIESKPVLKDIQPNIEDYMYERERMALLDNPINVSREPAIMGGYNKIMTKQGTQYNDIWDLDAPITFKSLVPSKVSENPLLENIFYKTNAQGVQSPKGVTVPVSKVFGKPFMSHGNLPYTSTEYVNALKNEALENLTNIEKRVGPAEIRPTEREARNIQRLKDLENYPKYEQGGIIKDDRGQWDHPGEVTEIGSNDITMEGVPYDVLGISDTGDIKLMKPGKNYKFKGKKVTEYPMAKNGVNQQDQKTFEQLDQLTNFTNYNKPTIGGWLNKYN